MHILNNLTILQETIRVVFLSVGTRGDIQPPLLLSKYLVESNSNIKWDPVIVTSHNFQNWIESNGIEFAPISHNTINVDDELKRPEVVEALSNGDVKKFLELLAKSEEEERDMLSAIEMACKGAHLIISHQLTLIFALTMKKKYDIPIGTWNFFPYHETSEFPHFVLPIPSFWLWNRFTYRLLDRVTWPAIESNLKRWSNELGNIEGLQSPYELRRMIEAVPTLYSFSPTVAAKPKDWQSNVHVGGFITDKKIDTPLDSNLLEFIRQARNDNRPVVYIGFGSMPVTYSSGFPKLLNSLDIEVKRARKGYRFIVFTGKATPGHDLKLVLPNSHDYFPVSSVSHSALFPLCDLIVHHGGAGTTAAALSSGTPSIVIPVIGDQNFWAGRTRKVLELKAKVMSYTKFNAKQLVLNIEEALIKKRKAIEISELINSEDGFAKAEEWMMSLLKPQNRLRSHPIDEYQ